MTVHRNVRFSNPLLLHSVIAVTTILEHIYAYKLHRILLANTVRHVLVKSIMIDNIFV